MAGFLPSLLKSPFRQATVLNLIVLVSILLPLYYTIPLPVRVPDEVKAAYDFVSSRPTGTLTVYTVHITAASWPEVGAPFMTVLDHAILKKFRLVFISDDPQGPPLILQGLRTIGAEKSIGTYGKDWVLLGYLPAWETFGIVAFMSDVKVFSKDYYGNDLSTLPLMNELPAGKNAQFILANVGATSTIDPIIRNVAPLVPTVLAGTTATGYGYSMPYYHAGLIKGIVSSGKSAAGYETLLGRPGLGLRTQGAISIPQVLLLVVMALGNLSLLTSKLGRRK